MFADTRSLPEEPAELRDAAVNLVALVKSQTLQIEKLKHELAGHRRRRFGSRSEALDQLELRLEDEGLAAAKAGEPAPPEETEGATARRWPTGLANRRPCWSHWPMRSVVMC